MAGVIPNEALPGVAALLIANVKYMALGESDTAVAASDTTLGDELVAADSVDLERVLLSGSTELSRTTTTVTNDTAKWYHIFTAAGTKTVKEIGIFDAAYGASDILYWHDVLSPTKALVSGDTLTVTCTMVATDQT